MKRAEIITALLEQARDKDTLANYDPNSIFTFDANVLTEAALMVCMYGDYCHDYYLSEYLSGLRENEEKVLSDWRRIAEEREQEE